jgi:GNAT superfamily N-acetyltransferase
MVVLTGLLYQIYCTNIYFRLEKDLTNNDPNITCGIKYQLSPGTDADMSSIVRGIEGCPKETAKEIIIRKRFYDFGFHKFYIAREMETRQPCFLAWLISPNDGETLNRFITKYFTKLKPDEVLLEGSLAFDNFRGKNVSPSVTIDLAKVARNQGYRRMITYVHQDNSPAIKFCEKIGFKRINRVIERRVFFLTRRTVINTSSLN